LLREFADDVPIGWVKGILGLDPKSILKEKIHEFLINRLVLGVRNSCQELNERTRGIFRVAVGGSPDPDVLNGKTQSLKESLNTAQAIKRRRV
jgi:hypothetical protein